MGRRENRKKGERRERRGDDAPTPSLFLPQQLQISWLFLGYFLAPPAAVIPFEPEPVHGLI